MQQKKEKRKESKVIKAKTEKQKPAEVVGEESEEVIAEPQTLHDIQPDIPEPEPVETAEEEDAEEDAKEEPEEDGQIPGQVELEDIPGVVPEAHYEEVTEDAGTDVDTITGMPEGSGAAGDDLESGTDAGASGETEDADTACQYDAGNGTAEGGGCETDPGAVEEDIWMEVRAEYQKLTQYLTVWSDKESLMELDVLESIRLKAINLAAGIEKIMILRARENE